jgi:ATP-dependent DNA helicase RecG
VLDDAEYVTVRGLHSAYEPQASPARALNPRWAAWQNVSMPFAVTDLDGLEAERALQTEEGHTSDVKAIEVSPAKLTRSMAAFSNAEGGDLFIGIDEDKSVGTRTWRGFPSIEAANGHLQAFEMYFPLGEFADYQFLRCTSDPAAGLILKVALQKTPNVRRSSDKTIYVRRGAQNLPVTDPEAIRRLEYAKGVVSFETHPVDAPLWLVTNSETIIGFMLDVVPTGEPLPWLTKQLLIRNQMPTVASILLFSDEPQAALPKEAYAKGSWKYGGIRRVVTGRAMVPTE